MELFSQLFKNELVFPNFDCTDRDDFFEKISTVLVEKGYVKETFKQAIKQREDEYPTGLRTVPYHVAIPHTDPVNICKPFIAVIRPTKRIEFLEMGSDDKRVDAQLLFILGLKRGEGQTALLQKLIEMFMQREVMDQLLKESNHADIIKLLKKTVA
ncbi:PTS sugar transporter subunit IIA [Anaerobacillus alkalilacustris]|uniref:PTS sugar transporter subunit IIA n=1 Tax=Anaerobacillus alkalilacustris TaxID=393763 RepID=UPI000A042AE8|nr:PTS sugar transporter subunit IIA [Anaerobacillus alkalilacustris]